MNNRHIKQFFERNYGITYGIAIDHILSMRRGGKALIKIITKRNQINSIGSRVFDAYDKSKDLDND